jgi:hypothetical protein
VRPRTGGQHETLAAPLGAALLSKIVASIATSGHNRGRSRMRRGELDALYCGESKDFIAEWRRADPLLTTRAYADPYRN